MNRLRYNQIGVSPPLSIRNSLRLAAHIQMLPVLESGEETLVGGQAVMEGVMMRAPHSYCVAVRKPTGEIVTEEKPLAKCRTGTPIFRLPVLRGLGTLCQAMSLGMKALRFSANAALDEGDPGKKSAEMSAWAMAGESGLLACVLHLHVQVRSAVYRRVYRQRLQPAPQ